MTATERQAASSRDNLPRVSKVRLHRWQVTEYDKALRWQHETAAAVRRGEDEALALLQHPPVFTFGRRVRPEHLLAGEATLRDRGAQIVATDRGGDITFHGPGQLIAYPVFDLGRRGLGPIDYVRALEETLISTLAHYGLEASRASTRPGVWIEELKIASVGVRVSRGVTTHGFALNVDTDLSWFEAIVPCGITGVRMTSMAQLLATPPGIAAVSETAAAAFESVFGLTLTEGEAPARPGALGGDL